jgi:hypothetical protein
MVTRIYWWLMAGFIVIIEEWKDSKFFGGELEAGTGV